MKKILLSIISCLMCNMLFGQIKLSGFVYTVEQSPLSNVSISIDGVTFQSQTNEKGGFLLTNLNSGTHKLSFNALGYNGYEEVINLFSDTILRFNLTPITYLKQEVLVTSTRVNTNSGMAYSELDKTLLQSGNLGQDVPYILQLLPSVVVTSDAGTGIGYTGIRIRGSDPTRINVSVNGIPINDTESQQMYWVDLPDILSSTENIQVQRGVGSSVNGAGSFGGNINLQSSNLSNEKFANSSNSFGTFNSIKNNINLGTGLINDHWIFEGRLSRIKSDGFVNRGRADLKSYSLSSGYINKKTILRLNIFSGKEITYQSWNGIPESRFNDDNNEMHNYIDRNGLDSAESVNLLNSGIKYNYFTYDNQVDNYQQDHYQFFFSQMINKKCNLNIALHYTKGNGFYEEYKKNQNLSDYSIIAIDTLIKTSDLIRRKWLDNAFYGVTYNAKYQFNKNINSTLGGALNRYEGKHFGEVIWARYAGSSEIRQRYYYDKADKNDFNIYNKTEISIGSKLIAFTDLQIRMVDYTFNGLDDIGNTKIQNSNIIFFNPKIGITYNINTSTSLYGSIAKANKEPNRDDYVESTAKSRPKSESLTDFEFGTRFINSKLKFSANAYFMNYNNQLVLTGRVNDVGNYTRTNTKNSYRTGLELELSYSPNKIITLDGNLTLSENKIKSFDEFLDSLDASYSYAGQSKTNYRNTTIAFSPSIIYMSRLSMHLIKNLTAQVILKHVGEQYLDNTTDEKRKLKSYNVCDIKINYSINSFIGKVVEINFSANNIFSKKYASNGYTYGYYANSERVDENFYYPQALLNFLGQITFKF